MTGPEYLRHFRPDLLIGSVDEMVQSGKLQDKVTLMEYLSEALEYLKTVPGPNLPYRKDHSDDWIGWWVSFLKTDSGLGQVVPFEDIKSVLQNDGKTSGVLFGGKSEGHRGHRYAVNWLINHVDQPVLLLEREWYAESEPRGGRFIDLRAGISMWARFNPKLIVSILPQKLDPVPSSVHYKKLFDVTGADYCFASRSDPFRWQKVARGKLALFTIIPGVSVQHTSHSVQYLDDDDDSGEWLNTTDHVRRMLPEVDFKDLISRLEPDLTEI